MADTVLNRVKSEKQVLDTIYAEIGKSNLCSQAKCGLVAFLRGLSGRYMCIGSNMAGIGASGEVSLILVPVLSGDPVLLMLRYASDGNGWQACQKYYKFGAVIPQV